MQTAARNAGRTEPVGSALQTAVRPVAQLAAGAADATSDFAYGLFSARSLTRENAKLRARVAAMSLYDLQIARLEREVDSLRRTLALPAIPGKQRITTQVVGFFPYENRISIGAGRAQGVSPGMPVVNADGLVGLVQTADERQSQVVLLTSFGQQIGAIDVSRNPPPAGLLRGRDFTTLTITFTDPKAAVVSGDLIATGGFSPLIPKGLPIGRVIDVNDDLEFGTRRANVDPAVAFGSLREVQVLR